MLKIIGSLTSPFARMTRVTCEELGLAYEMDVTTFYTKMTEEQHNLVNAHNPLMKIPVLIDGETEIIDSQAILRYLLRNYGKAGDFGAAYPASPAIENQLTVIYGIIEAGVLRFIFTNAHPEINANGGYMARCKERIEAGLQWLDRQSTLGQSFDVPEAALICALEWFQKRKVCAWDQYAHLVKIHTTYAERSSLVKTRIPETA